MEGPKVSKLALWGLIVACAAAAGVLGIGLAMLLRGSGGSGTHGPGAAGAIEKVLAQDEAFYELVSKTRVDPGNPDLAFHTYKRYLRLCETISLSECPGDFAAAYRKSMEL